jgi:putative addiction module component (TIGR02574 family)
MGFKQFGDVDMPATVKSLGIDRLPREERLALVQEIWDSIVAEPSPSLLSDTQRQELARRVSEDDATPDNVIPWEQVKAQTLARLQKP